MLIRNDDKVLLSLETAKGNFVYVSHAHSDHALKGKHKKGMVMSKPTSELIGTSTPIVNMDGIKLINSGHILGSSQLVASTDGGKLVYSGDIRLDNSILFHGAEIEECDILIVESTYGEPGINFPDCWDVYSDLHRWVKQHDRYNIVIGAYSLGKAQEIIKLLNEIGIAPIIDRKTERFCKIYDKYGIHLDRIPINTDESAEIMKGPFVVITPPRIANRFVAKSMELKFKRPTLSAITTGLGNYFNFNVDRVFQISDHADFNQIIRYIEMSNPKIIYTHHGSSEVLARELRKRGYNAQPYSSFASKQRFLNL